MNSRKFTSRLLLLVACCCAGYGNAGSPQIQGYLSQGVIYSPDNPFYDDDTGTNFNLRELGINITWSANDKLRLAGQVTSRKAGDIDDGDPRLDFLLADYTVLALEEFSAGIRLGRVKNPYGLYNTIRDVPHGRPGVFVPQSVYFDSLKGAMLSADGASLYFSNSNRFFDVNFDVYGGKTYFYNDALEYMFFQRDLPGAKVRTLASSHSPFFSMPDRLTTAIIELIGEMASAKTV